MIISKKTYYAMCVVSAALNILQAALQCFGIAAGYFGTAAAMLFCVAMLFLAGADRDKNKTYMYTEMGAVVLGILSMCNVPIIGAFVWPSFAYAYFKLDSKEIKKLASIVIVCGVGGGILSLFARQLGIIWQIISVIIFISQLIFAYSLFKTEATLQENGDTNIEK
ncbi:MAG: hypothetical protein RR424_00010 [Oscillospiraceae bacterium]